MIPRKGAYVDGISLKDIHEVYEIRAALEALALELAAKYITDEELDELALQGQRRGSLDRCRQIKRNYLHRQFFSRFDLPIRPQQQTHPVCLKYCRSSSSVSARCL